MAASRRGIHKKRPLDDPNLAVAQRIALELRGDPVAESSTVDGPGVVDRSLRKREPGRTHLGWNGSEFGRLSEIK